MIVRNPTTIDVSNLALLMSELGYEIGVADLECKLVEFDRNEHDQVYVAESRGEILGCITCHITTLFHQIGNSGRITSLVVAEASRGTGVGRRLMEQAEEYFKAMGCVKIEVTSSSHRLAAHEFYLNYGFERDEMRFIKLYS